MCIVNNSAKIFVSPIENFLLWIRIILMINTLVLIVIASRATQDNALMEFMTLIRAHNRGLVSDNRANLRFVYCLSSSINPPAVSGISGVIRFF